MVGRSLEDFPASAVGINIRTNSVMSSHFSLADRLPSWLVFWAAAQPGCSAGHFLSPASWSAPGRCVGHATGCRRQFWSPRLPSQHLLSTSHPSASFSLLSCCHLLLQKEVTAASIEPLSGVLHARNEKLCLHPLCDGGSGTQTSPWATWCSLSFCPLAQEHVQVAKARWHV